MSEQQQFYNYINQQLNSFPDLLTDYRQMTKKIYFQTADAFSAWQDLPSLFSMDKQLKVSGESTTVGKDDANYTTKVSCPLSGNLEIQSVFQSIYHVPLGGIDAIIKAEDGSETRTVTLDAEGKATVTDLTPGKYYEVVINNKPTPAEMDSLFSHYDELSGDLVSWLNGKWKTFKPEWDSYFTNTAAQSVLSVIRHFADGIWKALKELWDGIGEIYDMLKDPKKALKDMVDGASDIIDAIKNAASSAPDMLEKALLFASDEAALYLFVRAMMAYISMVPLAGMLNKLAEMGGNALAGVLLGLLGGVIVTFIATPATGVAYATYRAVKTAGVAIKKVIQPLLNVIGEIFAFAKKLILKACDKFKRIAMNRGGRGTYRNGKLEFEANNRPNTKLHGDHDALPDDSHAPTNESGRSTQDSKGTVCDKDPISMATGEELLSLTDGHLIGLLPFEWQRLYRTAAVETHVGLGYGWSHSLSHQLTVDGDAIIWRDGEGKLTRFPRPTEQLPAITNRMAKSAAFLGSDKQQMIIASGERFYTFKMRGDSGLLTSIKDQYDHSLSITYDRQHRPVRISTETNLRFELVYTDDLITQVDLYAYLAEQDEWQFVQTQVSYGYNAQSQLITATNASGETERYTYDAQHVIQSRELAGGAVFRWEWQGEGKDVRAVRQYSNLTQVDTRYDWDEDAGTVTLTNSDGSQQVYQHDDNARLIKEVDGSGGEYLKAYDDKGRLTKETDALGNVTESVYNDAGELVAKVEPNGLTTHFSYKNGLLALVQQDKAVWRYRHDRWGHITEQSDPLGHTTTYDYNDHGLIEKITYPDGGIHQLTWNRNGHLVDETTPQGEVIRYRYDILGRLRLRHDSQGVTELSYDRSGRLTKQVLPGGQTRFYEYNAYNKVTKFTDEQGRATTYDYEFPLHLVTQKTNPDGSTVQYRYDNPFHFVSAIINERGEHYQIDYLPTGHVQREVTFDGRQFVYEYDAHTQLTAKTEIGSEGTELTTRYAYDAQGKLIEKTLPDESTVQYSYDLLGNLTGVDDGRWPLAYDYDVLGRLTTEHQGWATTGYRYDALGHITAQLLPDGQQLDYDFRHGRLHQVNLNGHCLTQHQYQVSGLETRRTQGALSSHFQYDETGRLTEHRVSQAQQQTLFRRYQYNRSGNLTQVEDNLRGLTQYHYDPLDRLTQVRGSLSENFAHDPAGNLIQSRQSNVAGNRLLFQGDRHYQYDEFGNLIQEARGTNQSLITRYQYDGQHRLTHVEKPDGTIAEYQYDAFGRRTHKTVTDKTGHQTTTEFLWQGDKLLAESGERHYQTYLYEYGSFKPLALVTGEGADNATPYFYHLDQIGTPLEITDAEGGVAWSVDYHSYGNVAYQRKADIVSPLRFQGQYYDEETGLHYNRHRYYSPDSGRFITPDPIGLAGGLNNYQYVKNPTGWIDPLGLSQCAGSCAGGGSVSTKPNNDYNWQGKKVETYTGHQWSPLDPAMSEPPIVNYGPFTDAQRKAFLKGKSGGTKIAPHHRHQLPVETHGGVIDELRGPGHPDGNNHTALVDGLNRHPGESYFNKTDGGQSQRAREIREHFRQKGTRLVAHPTENGMWVDPSPK
ncbi:RHS repeat-associated core domain-containing protein [Vibrio spartinae]|uniref:Cell wall-associated polypeptide CWBP200 n=1 Tax=Vibrio spartinae TaxID=1918945 RepID=A0ABX6QZE1_9VIBR|nr:RHS repeat-associated core domain-containing protein [Vibrio spartinae]QMV14629.1 Cell wall-associated polypeptide CWBP200 [Vibrio spartinae]